jgi:serine/threonine-protein kinase RsbW/stage II sporulation protein AB (anti-sigma F factor)
VQGIAFEVASATWSIRALAEEVGGVRRAAVEFARGQGVPDPRLEDLRLAISEAVTNAVVHAFLLQDRPGTVTVSVDVTLNEFIEAVVRDDRGGMTSRDDSPGLGLGLGLISSVADAVEQRLPANGVGFELWMCFRFGGT